mmetsp:Transcript_29584/g.62186  ORF Transcript_29584/g.62186 Transcript_29584/m.62186 type:complete len:173 (-) Transcript_29584:153-671(-)
MCHSFSFHCTSPNIVSKKGHPIMSKNVPKSKAVTMQPFITVDIIKPATKQEKSSLYYSPRELNQMSVEAKALAKSFKTKMTSSTQDQDQPLRPESDETLRGLEVRIDANRGMKRVTSRRMIVKCHRELMRNPNLSQARRSEILATVCMKVNRWSTDIALEAARVDFLRANSR